MTKKENILKIKAFFLVIWLIKSGELSNLNDEF